MHILLTPVSYPSKEHPVRGIFFREQAQALQRTGYKVGVILPQPNFKKIFKEVSIRASYENDDGIHIYRQNSWALSCIPTFSHYMLLRTAKSLLTKYINKHGKPDIIHAHCAWFGGIVGSYLKEKFRIPLVITEHSSAYSRKLLTSTQLALAKKAFIDADARIIVSPSLGDTLESCFSKEIRPLIWIPNLVDNNFQTKHLKFNKNKHAGFCFLNIALMDENKGQADLLYAFAENFRNDENIQLRIGGDGVIFSDLKNLAYELGIIKQVMFLGRLTREQVLDEMQSADVFVLSSHYETFGVVLIEALACGKPIISTACGGPEYIVNQDNGLLVPPKNPYELGKAMLKLRDTVNKYKGDVIYKDCISRFSEKAVIGQLSELYKQVLV